MSHDTFIDTDSGSQDAFREDTVAPLARIIAARARDTVCAVSADTPEENPITLLKAKLAMAEYSQDSPLDILKTRKARLMELADHMPYVAECLLARFRALALEAGVDPGALALHIVGGRVRADPKPLSDNSDFDLVITASNPLLTGKDVLVRKSGYENIAPIARIRIFKALYAELPEIFAECGLEFEP